MLNLHRYQLVVTLLLSVALGVASSAPGRGEECVLIEDFAKGTVGEFPPGWKLRKDEGRGVYSVREEGARRYLHASSRGLGIQAAKEFAWDIAKYPVLAWSWRPVEFPAGADERDSKK